jgi:hypothetical protein
LYSTLTHSWWVFPLKVEIYIHSARFHNLFSSAFKT